MSQHTAVTTQTAIFAGLAILMLAVSGPSCNKEEFILLPDVSLDEPVITLDSVKLIASFDLEEVLMQDLDSFGFRWGTDPDLQSAISLQVETTEESKFDTMLAGLDLDRDYYVQAYIAIDGTGFIVSNIDRVRTGDIALSTSFSATGQRFFDSTSELVLEVVQLNANASGLRPDKRVQSRGHIWISRDSRESLLASFGTLDDVNVNLDGVNKAEVTMELPEGVTQFPFTDDLELDPLQYHLVRPFVIYNDMIRYGDTVGIFIGNAWERLGDIDKISHAPSFVIGDLAYITTGMINETIEDPTYHDSLVVYDPKSNSFSYGTRFDGDGRIDAVAFSVNEKGYVGSGRRVDSLVSKPLSDFWEYDPGEDTWVETFPLPIEVFDAVSFVINDKAYVGTGNLGADNGDNFEPTDRIFRLDDTGWTEMPNFEKAISNAVATVIDDTVYILTGQDVNREFWRGDGSSFTLIDIPSDGRPGPARQSAVSFAIGRRLYVGAGSNDIEGFVPSFGDFYVYDLDRPERLWVEVDNLSNGLRANGTAFEIDDKGYYWGGLLLPANGIPRIAAAVWEYTPAPN